VCRHSLSQSVRVCVCLVQEDGSEEEESDEGETVYAKPMDDDHVKMVVAVRPPQSRWLSRCAPPPFCIRISLSYLTRIISQLSMLYTYMKCHGRSSPSSPPTLARYVGGFCSPLIDSGRGAARAEDAQGTPTPSHISPSILVYED